MKFIRWSGRARARNIKIHSLSVSRGSLEVALQLAINVAARTISVSTRFQLVPHLLPILTLPSVTEGEITCDGAVQLCGHDHNLNEENHRPWSMMMWSCRPPP